jgi:hypothetical protein
VAVIDPREIKTNSQPPPVVIESVKIDNELSEPPAAAGGLSAGASNVDEKSSGAVSNIIVNPNQQNFEISYTAAVALLIIVLLSVAVFAALRRVEFSR